MKELRFIQSTLKAPKKQTNKHMGYKFRSCEDILEAVKPLLENHKCVLTLSDTVVNVGDRNYVKAVATISKEDLAIDTGYSVSAYAREAVEKRGLDDAQITGSASSYARKYALNGLFAIDDTKDADTDEAKNIEKKPEKKAEVPVEQSMTNKQYSAKTRGQLMFLKSKGIDTEGKSEEAIAKLFEATPKGDK